MKFPVVFKSRKDTLTTLLVFTPIIATLLLVIFSIISKEEYSGGILWTLTVSFLVLIVIIWFFFSTKYILTNTHLLYSTGPIKGKIQIDCIHTIIADTTLYVGIKIATARNGLLIKYNKYDELYISPKVNSSFIKTMTQINPEIKICYKTSNGYKNEST